MTVLWFTNLCEDCRRQIPALNALELRPGEPFRVLAVSILAADEPLPGQVAPDCRFPVLLDPDDIVTRRFGLEHPPGACPLNNLFIVGPSGRVMFRGHLSALGPQRFKAVCDGLIETGGGT